ncbi:hypothetical protein B0H14DRAFT_3434516 [Mycena olivaceomarginata]|jgi:uncharacterized protein YjiS (DUF1127 family)|nr:hypothetical protein B0H14DRAFT_3434516 [Mycena olivaceomarginata]
MSQQWCFDECMHCGRVLDTDASYCSDDCHLAAVPVQEPESDDDYENENDSYSAWLRVSLWAQAVDPTPPPSPSPHVYTSPSKRILTPQYPTACITSDSTVSARHHASPPRPARTSPTATESLVASSTTPSSLGGLVRSWAQPREKRPQLSRLTTANFALFAKTHHHPPPPPQLLASDESSDGDVSPVWWVSQEPPSASNPHAAPHFVVQRGPPAPRGRKVARALP